MTPKDLAVCFSGGLDSTTVSYVMGRRYRGRVHLLTIQHGHGHLFPQLTRRHVEDLKRLLGPDRVRHRFLLIGQEFRRLVMGQVFREVRRYGSNFVVCLGCNLTMDAHAIAYCLEHRVPTILVGFTPKGAEFAVMSLPETSRERRRIYGSYGLLYRVPLLEWHMYKPEERVLLRQAGIWPGWNFRKIAMGVQPICLLGVLLHHMDIFFDIHPRYDRSRVVEFIRDKEPLVRRMVEEMLARKGIDPEERVREMRARNADEWPRYGPDAPPLDPREERRLTAEQAAIPALDRDLDEVRDPAALARELSLDGRSAVPWTPVSAVPSGEEESAG